MRVGWTLLLTFGAAFGQPAPPVARKALDLLLAEKYPDFISLLSPIAKDKFTPDFLHKKVGPELKSFGNLNNIGTPVSAKEGSNTLVSFPVKFSRTPVNVQFTIDVMGKVAGLYFRPANSPLPAHWTPAAYSKAGAFHQREITVGADPWKLGGTLTIPESKGRFPAIVLVHGPGPDDRDETIYSNRIFRDLGEGLASRGIAVLRYDKRTKIYGDRMGDIDFTIQEETIDDAVKALSVARQQPEIDPDRVFLLGHSLGGYASPRIAWQDGKVAGVIFLAANARPIEDVALDQNEYVVHLGPNPPPEVLAHLEKLKVEVAKVKRLQPGKTNPPVVMGLPSSYLLDLKSYDPVGQARRLTIPMLFLQGERDFQVTMKDFNLWKSGLQAKPNARFQTFETLNHLFIAGEGRSSPVEYRTPGNVDAAVIAAISAFVSGPSTSPAANRIVPPAR